MQLDKYELIAGQNLTAFKFLSEGRKGKILKIVQLQSTVLPYLYNLAFGDEDPITGELNDMIITDNGDAEKVLATVVSALYIFTDQVQDVWIHATGSTRARTRLYQMGINKYYDVVQADFEIMGQQSEEWLPYEKGNSYEAFAVRRKIYKFE